jgi:hypothetical protein
MSDVGGMDPTTLWTLVGGGVGSAIAAFAIRMGWKNGGKEIEQPSANLEIKSAIIDSSSVKVLAASIEGLGFTLLELKKDAHVASEGNVKLILKLIESIDANTQELREHAREIREHAREVAKKG